MASTRPQRLARQLRELMAASATIHAALGVREILPAVARQARRVIGAQQALVDAQLPGCEPVRAFSAARPRGEFDLERDGLPLADLLHRRHRPLRLSREQLKTMTPPGSRGRVPPGLRGWLAAPLIGRDGQTMGAIQLANKEGGQFTEEDEFLLSELAQFAAVAVENVQLHNESRRLAAALERKRVEQELRARLRQQAAVVELGGRALAGTTLDALLDEAAQRVAQTLEAEYCKILELLPGGEELLLRAGVGWKEGCVGRRRISAGLGSHAGFTLVSSEPVIIQDLRTEARFTEPLLQEHGVISGMSAIIAGEGRPFGVLGVHTASRREFTRDDVNFLQAIANVLAIAIERNRADQALRQSEDRFRRAQKSANIGAYEWNLRTGDMKWSEELAVIKNLSPDGKFATWQQHVHPDDQRRVTQALDQALANGGDFDLEYRMVTPAGLVWLASRGQVFCERGVPAQVLGVVIDITSRKAAEELLRRSEKLAVIGRLAATIAHEINNPLESVTNLLYLLEHHPALDETARHYAQLAQQELHRVAHIARQTLSFHRESATAVPVRLSELLENALQLHARRIAAAGIAIERRYEYGAPVPVFPAEMQQVVSNLVLNALEALGARGRLIIHLSRGVEWTAGQRRGVRLVIADTGPGIPPAHRQQVFEPFFTTKGEKGTGLGLWVIKGIVQKHHGSIRLRSSVAPGRSFTCFSLFLPAGPVAVDSAPQSVSDGRRQAA